MRRHTPTRYIYTPRIPCHTPTPIPPLKGGRIGVGVSGATSQPVEQHLATPSHTTFTQGVVAAGRELEAGFAVFVLALLLIAQAVSL